MIPLFYDHAERPLHSGEYADLWKSQYQGREVAVKVLKVITCDLERTKKVGFPRFVMCVDELTVSHAVVMRGGCGMESSPSS